MKSNKMKLFIGLLVLCTCVFAFLHLTSREEIPENALKITMNDKAIYVDLDQLTYQPVTGTRVNGKGQEIEVNGEGILLRQVLTDESILDYEKVTIIADDSYQVEVSRDEVNEGNKVYLLNEDGLRLIVFGDSNSKRSVSNVVEMVIEE